MTFLIAEISNHHFGSIEKAKELILAAKNSGADAVKGQAFAPEDMSAWGSMPFSFYEKCALKYQEYKALIGYGEEIEIPVFFTILSEKLNFLAAIQKFKKMHAGLSGQCAPQKFWHYDKPNCFISMKEPRLDVKEIRKAKIFYATDYLFDADIFRYEALRKFYKRDIGVSHHGKECDTLYHLHKMYGLPHVEKHFYLGDEISWDGQVYRDCLHSFTPAEFSEMAKRLK